ncbi:MAG: hypothetical protein SNJ81_16565, partial [Cyanobacteriota bacterium]
LHECCFEGVNRSAAVPRYDSRKKSNDELGLGHQSPHGLQIALGIGAFAEGGHRDPLHFGQQAHDKPPIQRASVRKA